MPTRYLPNRQPPTRVSAAVLFVLTFVGAPHARAEPWQSPESIASAAKSFAQRELRSPETRFTIAVDALDDRLRLPRCIRPLEGFIPYPATRLSRNVTVGIRCTAPKPWRLFVPVTVSVIRSVLVTTRALPRGAEVAASDVRQVERDIAGLRGTYITHIDHLTNAVTKRAIDGNTLLTMEHLRAKRMIKRGQNVTLLVDRSGLTVRMAGTAMADGHMNQRIRVQNDSSKKIVEGIVRGSDVVEIVL